MLESNRPTTVSLDRNPSSGNTKGKAIEEYLGFYEYMEKTFEQVANTAKETCETALKRENVPCTVTRRVKTLESLKNKLYARQKARKQPYRGREEIENDIVDLAGVRIALYFPRQKTKVKEFLDAQFNVVEVKSFPEKKYEGEEGKDENAVAGGGSGDYARRFSGYCADHYRVFLKPKQGNNSEKVLYKTKIEIQVVSVLRNAWAEVEHDMVYKEIWKVTPEDHRILDGLSGAIYLGECLLDQLYDSQMSKSNSDDKPFDMWTLGAFLSEWIDPIDAHQAKTLMLDVQWLLNLLEILELDTPRKLREKVRQMDFSRSLHSDYRCFEFDYRGCKPSAALYIMDRIIWPTKGDRQVPNEIIGRVGHNTDTEEKYKLGVISSAIVWLDQLIPVPADLFELVFASQTWEDQQVTAIKWLDSRKPQDFYQGEEELSSGDKRILQVLWQCFEKNDKRPIQFAFAISRLGVLQKSSPDWPALKRIISPLLTVNKSWRL